jgi:hypothetical protein
MPRERDTRRIVHGVQLYEAGQAVTYADGDEDLLEEVLTPERGKELLEAGDLAGEGWKFSGSPAPPMAGSRLAVARAAGGNAVKELEAAEEQRARVKALGPKEARRRALDEARAEKESQAAAKASAEQAEASAKEQQKAERAEARAEHAHGHKGK